MRSRLNIMNGEYEDLKGTVRRYQDEIKKLNKIKGHYEDLKGFNRR